MEQEKLLTWFGIGQLFQAIRMTVGIGGDKPMVAVDVERNAELIDSLIGLMNDAELSLSVRSARRIRERLARPILGSEFAQMMHELQSRVEDELESTLFFRIPREKARFFATGATLFTERVHIAFPAAGPEIEQAGKCYATGRNTACVFHLMRAMEVGLEALRRDLKIAPWSPTWDASIKAIEGKLSAKAKKKQTRGQRRRNEFIASAAGYIRGVANAWRNPTMHRVECNYDEEQAMDVFNAVAAFMRFLADNLAEKKAAT